MFYGMHPWATDMGDGNCQGDQKELYSSDDRGYQGPDHQYGHAYMTPFAGVLPVRRNVKHSIFTNLFKITSHVHVWKADNNASLSDACIHIVA